MSDDLNTQILIQIRDKISSVDVGLQRLREEHGEILREHGEILREHGEILREHGEILREHGGQLGAVEQQVRANGLTLKQVLGAVEYGNTQREQNYETRLTRIEKHLDLPPLES